MKKRINQFEEQHNTNAATNEVLQHKKSASSDQAIENNSQQSKKTAQLQTMINTSPRMQKAAQLQAVANNSPQVQKATQLKTIANPSIQLQTEGEKPNKTGLPDNLKKGVENLSGHSMDDVKVHRNSSKPAQLQAHAYAQGTDIHLGPGQEKHLAHETWHVAQQKQGRVKPTTSQGGTPVNDSPKLEKEADNMGAKAAKGGSDTPTQLKAANSNESTAQPVQQMSYAPVVQKAGGAAAAVGSITGFAALAASYVSYHLYQDSQIREINYTQVIQNIPGICDEILQDANAAGGNAAEWTEILAEGALLERNRQMEDTREKISYIGRKISEYMKTQGLTYEQLYTKYLEKAEEAGEDTSPAAINRKIIGAAGRSNKNLLQKFYGKLMSKL